MDFAANLGICILILSTAYSTRERVIIAKALKDYVEKETGLTLKLVSTFKGAELEHGKARHPWIDRDSPVVLGDHVTQDSGTGAVHTAPGHGADDYKVGQRYNLGVLCCSVNDSGQFTDEVPEWVGMNIFKANPLIIEKMEPRVIWFRLKSSRTVIRIAGVRKRR